MASRGSQEISLWLDQSRIVKVAKPAISDPLVQQRVDILPVSFDLASPAGFEPAFAP